MKPFLVDPSMISMEIRYFKIELIIDLCPILIMHNLQHMTCPNCFLVMCSLINIVCHKSWLICFWNKLWPIKIFVIAFQQVNGVIISCLKYILLQLITCCKKKFYKPHSHHTQCLGTINGNLHDCTLNNDKQIRTYFKVKVIFHKITKISGIYSRFKKIPM